MPRQRKLPPSALLNIRHGLTDEIVALFREQANERDLTHGEWLTEMVRCVEDRVDVSRPPRGA